MQKKSKNCKKVKKNEKKMLKIDIFENGHFKNAKNLHFSKFSVLQLIWLINGQKVQKLG